MAKMEADLKAANQVITSALKRKFPERTNDQIAVDVLRTTAPTFSRWHNGKKKIGKNSLRSISLALGCTAHELATAYSDLLDNGASAEVLPKWLKPPKATTDLEGVTDKPTKEVNTTGNQSKTSIPHQDNSKYGLKSSCAIEVDIDTMGRNEALGELAKRLVELVGVKSEALTHLSQIERNFKTSKKVLQNFMGIESPATSRILFDYSQPRRKKIADVERLMSAGVNVAAIRDYGEASLMEALRLCGGFFQQDEIVVNVVGEPNRTQTLVEMIRRILDDLAISHCVTVVESPNIRPQQSFFEESVHITSRLIAEIWESYEFETKADAGLKIEDFLYRQCSKYEPNFDGNALRNQFELYSKRYLKEIGKSISRKPITNLDRNVYLVEDYERILTFLATRRISVISPTISRRCRDEGYVSELMMEAMHAAASEDSFLDVDKRAEIWRELRLILQIRSGVIPPVSGFSFFKRLRRLLPLSAQREAAVCLYQMSYYCFLSDKENWSKSLIGASLAKDSQNPSALAFAAVLEIQAQQEDAALELLASACDIDNGYAYSHFYTGVIFETNGEYENAVASYIRCLIICPNFYESALNLTNCLIDSGQILDASRLASAFLSKFSVPSLEFQTNIAVGLFDAGHSNFALKMLQATFSESAAPLVALNIAKIYYGRVQAATCKEWCGKVLMSDAASVQEKKEARAISELVGKQGNVEASLSTQPVPIVRNEKIGDALSVLLAQSFQLTDGTNNIIFQTVRRAIKAKVRTANKFVPKSVLASRNAEQKKAQDRKRAEQRRRYQEQIKQGQAEKEAVHIGRKRRRYHSKERFFSDGITLTRAPSYSAG